MEFQKVTVSREIYDDLLLFVFRIYQSTSGKYPRLEWISEKPSTDDFSSFSRVYGPFLKFRLEKEFDELYVMREKEIIATFALVYKFENKHIKWIPATAKRHCVFLEFFMVHPEFRARGLGTEALRIAQEKANELDKKICVITFEDLQAYNYYLKNGFELKLRFGPYALMER